MDGLSVKSLLGAVSVVFLLRPHFCKGQSPEVGLSPPIVTMVGEDVVLPCHLQPPADAVQMEMEWGKPDLNPRFVYVWHGGQELLTDQNKAYKGRASLSVDRLKQGDVSLTLTDLSVSDNGRYRCYIPKQSKEYFVELLVGAVASPGITLASRDLATSGVVLDCKSAGWYPEPEVLWVDTEGTLLPAGPTETARGPDDLYTVSSRLTVERRHSNHFTCRVQQRNINQTREAQIYVPDDFFMAPSSCTACITFSVVLCFVVVAAVAFSVWRWRQNKIEMKMPVKEGSSEQLMAEIKKMEDLDQKKAKLKEEVRRSEEEQIAATQLTETLQEIWEGMKKQRGELASCLKEVDTVVDETKKSMNAVDGEVTGKTGDKTANRAQGYLRLKEIMIEAEIKHDKRRHGQQQLDMGSEKLMKRVKDETTRVEERKTELQERLEQIKKQMEEIDGQKEAIDLQSKKGKKK